MASARRGRLKTGSGQVPGYGRNYGPTRERPLPTVEDTYARIEHVPRQDDVYTMLNDDRQTAQEQPIPTRERPAGGRVVSQGPRGLPYETGSGNNHRSGRLENTNKIRLVIGVSICTIVVGLALSGAALWFFLKGDDTYPVTYEVKVTLPNAKFVENMKKTDSAEFTDMKKKYCEAVKSVFGGTLLNCAVDQLSNGSVIVLSALEFDWNELTDSVKKNNKLPVRQNIYEYIKEKIEDSDVKFLKDAKASTQVVPETATPKGHELDGRSQQTKLINIQEHRYRLL